MLLADIMVKQRLLLPVQVIEKTLKIMQKYGEQNRECIAYWLGERLDEDCIVVNEVYIPKQYATAIVSKVQETDVAKLFSILEIDEKVLVAQLHTHPGSAFHSSIDDEYPVAFEKNFLSLVVPYYGFIDIDSFPKLSKVHIYNEGSWSETPFEKVFSVIPRRFRNDLFHRTKLLIKDYVSQASVHINQLANYRVAVVLGEVLFENVLKYLSMLITAINLLARLSFNVDVFLPEIDTPEEFKNISIYKRKVSNLVRTIYYSINPFGTMKVNSKKKEQYDVALAIGAENGFEVNAKKRFFIDSSTWLSLFWQQEDFCGYSLNSEIKGYNPISACAAVTLGIAEVFKSVLNDVYGLNVEPNKSLRFSLLNYSIDSPVDFELQLPEVIDIGKVYLIGAGSLGSAIMYLLSLFSLRYKIRGTMYIVDPDVLEASNLSRHILATIADIGDFKVDIVLKRVRIPSLKVVSIPGKYQDLSLSDRENMDIAMVAVDNVETRWCIQRDLPRVLLHGAVYSNSILVSRHYDIINKGCLGCIYWKDTAKVDETRVYPAAPYALLFAGTVMVAELLKERTPWLRQYVLNNVLEVPDLLVLLKHDVSWFHRILGKADECGCNCKDESFISRYIDKWLKGC